MLVLAFAACGASTDQHKREPVDEASDDAGRRPFSDASGFKPRSFASKVSGHGRAVIFIPGLGCPGEVWDGTVDHLGDEIETHVLTLSGFAGRPRIDGPLAATVRKELIRYIRSRHLDKPIIVGHSLGGTIAYWLAATAPDLIGGVIIVDAGPALADTDDETARSLRNMWAQAGDDELPEQVRTAYSSMVTDPKTIEPILGAIAKSDRRTMGDAIYETVTTDLRDQVANIRAPVLVVLADGGYQQMITQQVEAIPDHLVKVMPHTRHFVMYDDPEGFYRLVDKFLAKH